MKIDVHYTVSCTQHGDMIADIVSNTWTCLDCRTSVSKDVVAQLIFEKDGEYDDAT